MRVVENMVSSLDHRGPDDDGLWGDDDAKIAFGHRRLSVLDLSQEGHQPIVWILIEVVIIAVNGVVVPMPHNNFHGKLLEVAIDIKNTVQCTGKLRAGREV